MGWVAVFRWHLCAAVVHAMSSRVGSWLKSRPAAGLKLGLLPFALEDALLPGETRDVWVFEERLVASLAAAAAGHGCIGAQHFTDYGDVVDASTVLEVEDFKADYTGGWARLKCVARCRLHDISKSQEGYTLADVSLFTDKRSNAAASTEDLRALHVSEAVRLLSGSVASQSVPKCVESLRAVHARTAEQRRQLFALLSLEFDERSLAAKSPGCGPRRPRSRSQRLVLLPPQGPLPLDRRRARHAWLDGCEPRPSRVGRSEEKSYIFVGPDKCEAPFGIFSGESEEESEAAYETADIFDLVAAEEEEYVFVGEPWERPSDGCGWQAPLGGRPDAPRSGTSE